MNSSSCAVLLVVALLTFALSVAPQAGVQPVTGGPSNNDADTSVTAAPDEAPLLYAPRSSDDEIAQMIGRFLRDDYLRSELHIMQDADRKFQYAAVDLNGDGKDELFVRFMGPYFCGTGGCTFLLLDESLEIITRFTVTEAPIFVEKLRESEWSVLVVRDRGVLKELRFGNGTYPSNPTVLPQAPYDAPGGHATVLFDEKFGRAKTYIF